MKPQVIVLAGHGINGELEMAQSFNQNEAEATIMHVEDLIAAPEKLQQFQILAFPGGFAYGDDLGAGNALANRVRNNLSEHLMNFVQQDKLTFGICNGFQVMANTGILPGLADKFGKRKVALKHNASGSYQCRWTHIKVASEKCIWTRDIDVLPISVGHGEGNFYTDPDTLSALKAGDQVAVQYCDEDGKLADGQFPINPNGALEDIAGICDHTGRIFGLMPHPDRFLTAYNEDLWTLKKEQARRAGQKFSPESPGQKIYQNGVSYFQ